MVRDFTVAFRARKVSGAFEKRGPEPLFFYVPVVAAVVVFLNSLMFYQPLVFLVISSVTL